MYLRKCGCKPLLCYKPDVAFGFEEGDFVCALVCAISAQFADSKLASCAWLKYKRVIPVCHC